MNTTFTLIQANNYVNESENTRVSVVFLVLKRLLYHTLYTLLHTYTITIPYTIYVVTHLHDYYTIHYIRCYTLTRLLYHTLYTLLHTYTITIPYTIYVVTHLHDYYTIHYVRCYTLLVWYVIYVLISQRY